MKPFCDVFNCPSSSHGGVFRYRRFRQFFNGVIRSSTKSALTFQRERESSSLARWFFAFLHSQLVHSMTCRFDDGDGFSTSHLETASSALAAHTGTRGACACVHTQSTRSMASCEINSLYHVHSCNIDLYDLGLGHINPI